jgi:tRNA (guanine-N7-)-methyltransferase
MLFRLRSFVRRGGRGTRAQARAQTMALPKFGLQIDNGPLNAEDVFGRKAFCFLEIGFGSGQSLLELAKNHPDKNFIGVETHKPGIGSLLMGIENAQLTNIRIYDADAIDVLEKCIPDGSLNGVQLFFPDPWPKHILQVLSAETTFINLANTNQFSHRSPYRPILTRFERRALHEGRKVRDLQFQKG